jgi:hypothetical protein
LAGKGVGPPVEPGAEGLPPVRALILCPFEEIGNSGGSDLVDSVSRRWCTFLWGCGCCQCHDPIAERVAGVGRFARGWIVCEQGDEGDERNDSADEECSPFSHAETMQRREVDERAN